MYYERDIKISVQRYFDQRILNIDDRFAKDGGYLFMAQSYVEREALEKKISLSYQRGKLQRNEDGIKVMEIGDSFSVFSEIPGSFKYWRKTKHELIAKCQQLGPFHFFLPYPVRKNACSNCLQLY